MDRFARAAFESTVAELSQLPGAGGAEVAFAGRSNAGKSSAINALTRRRNLAYVARAPGKTRTIQFYRLIDGCYLVDLPGYGYARVPESMRRRWTGLMERYLQDRASLIGLVLIMDARHPLTPLDQSLLGWYLPRRLPLHVLLSKTDKLSRSQAAASLRRVEAALSPLRSGLGVQLFSSTSSQGVETARAVIDSWFDVHCRTRPTQQRQTRTPG